MWSVICWAVRLFQTDSARKRSHNLHETYQLLCVQQITPDDGHRRCPKHVEFRDKIKFWILDVSCWLFIRRTLFYLTTVACHLPSSCCNTWSPTHSLARFHAAYRRRFRLSKSSFQPLWMPVGLWKTNTFFLNTEQNLWNVNNVFFT
jgi:hypothetical protein